MKTKIYIVGAGPGDISYLSAKALDVIKNADIVIASERIAKELECVRSDIEVSVYSESMEKAISSGAKCTCVLVSGDTGFYSATHKFTIDFGKFADIEILPALNSMQYLCSKLYISYENIITLSMHGRFVPFLGAVTYNKNVFMLTGGSIKAHDICKIMNESGLGDIKVTAGENLSLTDERIVSGTAKSLSQMVFGNLTVLLTDNPDFSDRDEILDDEAFVRSENTPMTKENIRYLSVSKLSPKKNDVIYDIGAGTGSVALSLAGFAHNGVVYAIEKDREAIELIGANIKKIKRYNVMPIFGNAAMVIDSLPKPDKAFIGGSDGELGMIAPLLFKKNPDIKIVINAITLETLNEAVNIAKKSNKRYDIISINVANAKKAGDYHMMFANNPVFIITIG